MITVIPPEPPTEQQTVVGRLDVKLRASRLANITQYSCETPITVVRRSPLTSYSYRGVIEAYAQTSMTGLVDLHLVNIVPHETYLKGVVPSEVYPTWDMEALKAQAVAARSYSRALLKKGRGEIDPAPGRYDVDDTIFFQAYLGARYENPRTSQAVDETEALVLTYNHEVINAYFSYDAGGFTETSGNAFGTPREYCVSKPEPFPVNASNATFWTKTATYAQLTERYRRLKLLSSDESVKGVTIDPADYSSSGRVLRLLVKVSGGRTFYRASIDFSGDAGLKSRMYKVKYSGSTMTFTGRGWGHGAGMSQLGAKILTGPGFLWDFRSVLEFYYEGAILERESNIPYYL